MHVSAADLDSILVIFKRLGFADKASELIAGYVDTHRDHIRSADERTKFFRSNIRDDEFKTALAAAVVPLPKRPIKDILTDLYYNKSKREDIEAVFELSVDDLYLLFIGLRGEELCLVIKGSLCFHNISNATDSQRALTKNAIEALERIVRQSNINAIRVQKFGVEIANSAPRDDKIAAPPDC